MSRQVKIALAILVGAVVVAAIMLLFRPQAEQEERLAQAPLVETVPLVASSGALEILATGVVEPREQTTIAAEISGRVVYVNPAFVEGSSVSAGAPLIRLEAADYRNSVRSARADVEAQRVAVLQAQEEVRIAENEIARFDNRQSGGANDAFAQAIDDSDYASRILPPRGMEPSPANTAARAEQTGALATREPQLRSAQAARERAAANLADAQLALGRTTIRAPFAGAVASESVARGAIVQPGQALGTLVANDSYEVRVSLNEADAALIPGLLLGGSRIPATVYADFAGVRYAWDALVVRADPSRNAETRLIEAFVRVPSPGRAGRPVTAEGETIEDAAAGPPLLLGSFVQVGIAGAPVERYVSIEVDHLRPGNVIYLARDGKLTIVPVRVLQRTDDRAIVTGSFLQQGGRLITGNVRAPVDGMAVRTASGQ
ncbi:MAG: HlyD family efflux transporter periplasmic adaptor subunit [Alteripontixanthobacter sp.]